MRIFLRRKTSFVWPLVVLQNVDGFKGRHCHQDCHHWQGWTHVGDTEAGLGCTRCHHSQIAVNPTHAPKSYYCLGSELPISINFAPHREKVKGSRKIPEDPKEEGCYLGIELSWMDKNGDQVSGQNNDDSRINIENISMLLFVYTDTNNR